MEFHVWQTVKKHGKEHVNDILVEMYVVREIRIPTQFFVCCIIHLPAFKLCKLKNTFYVSLRTMFFKTLTRSSINCIISVKGGRSL